MKSGRALLALLSALAALAAPVVVRAADSGALSKQQAQAREERQALQARIRALQQSMEAQEASLKDAALALRASEQAISDLSRELAALQAQVVARADELKALDVQMQVQRQDLAQRRAALARQLHAQYSSGLSPWTALLSGEDPQGIGRDFGYLAYVSSAQAQAVQHVRTSLAKLDALQAQTLERQAALDALVAETATRRKTLGEQRAEHKAIHERIAGQLAGQRKEAGRLVANEARLGKLVDALQREIAREAERARLAAEKRRAEAQRQAEERRRAQAAAEAQRARAARPPAPASVGVPPVLQGLGKRLVQPVSGEVLGRFGSERPDGGVWRGVVIRAAAGSPVKAIAAGKVAFASWLSGFGNIMILDHGESYLSVYAYNQSLLKEVGDPVAAGEAIATVGATGGQVEPGLYLEIRHHGKPVNPRLWLSP